MCFTLYQIFQTFNIPEEKAFKNILGKGKNAGILLSFSLFPTMFIISLGLETFLLATCNFLSANAFSLVWFTILSFGKYLIVLS